MIGTKLSPLDAFRTYIAVKQHFKQKKYNIFKQGIQIRATLEQLEDRNDKIFFHKLSSEYLAGDLLDYFMANILQKRNHPSEMEDVIYREYKARMSTISYIFEEDLKMITNLGYGFKNVFRTSNGNLPIVLQALNGSHINLETVCIIDILLDGNIIKCFDNEVTDPLVYKELRQRIVKYQGFIKADFNKLKILLNKYINN